MALLRPFHLIKGAVSGVLFMTFYYALIWYYFGCMFLFLLVISWSRDTWGRRAERGLQVRRRGLAKESTSRGRRYYITHSGSETELTAMVLIIGSKNASPKLVELVPQKFQDLTKFLKEDEINTMLQWIHKQPHLPRLTETQLMVFLNAANYSVERAKEVIDNYYTLRTRAPELFANRNPEKVLARAFKIAYFVSLPETVKSYSGNQIIILKLKDTDPANADFVEGVKTTFALVDITVGKYPLNKGMEIIMDMEGLVLGHLTKVDFSALRVFMTFCQDALPTQLKAIHVINTFSLINQVMAIVRPLLNIEFFKKIHFYTPNEFNKLTSEYIPVECLPRELGGSLDSIDVYQDEMFRQFKIATEWFEELEKYKVDESKRLGRRRSDLNVCDGSFRKLELD